MKRLSACVLAACVAAAACNRAEPPASTPGHALVPIGAGDAGARPATSPSNPTPPAPADAAAAATAAHSADRVHEVTIPAGTVLPVVLDTAIGSDISRVEQPVSAHLSRPMTLHGETILPVGSRVSGVVTEATRSARVKGRAHVALRFDHIAPRGDDERYAIRTASIGRTAEGTKRKDALEIGAPAAGGAIIGALVGGKKGALIGTAVGGGAGAGVVLSTRGKEVRLPRGAALSLRLAEPLTVRVR